LPCRHFEKTKLYILSIIPFVPEWMVGSGREPLGELPAVTQLHSGASFYFKDGLPAIDAKSVMTMSYIAQNEVGIKPPQE
jgi:hypothetical protein